ncbi:penicillin-insensitive murein endopeptidase [Oceanomicrobium pacificus]|uniref:Penicillin-insensitive murein endopeptidase n=1 Tax=Oceanomicrobium pacificus TaxID=2692916 RepID=A0A6B0TS85_9RHOB|nr:penicillin-insensitive murein endopeptidase [Oceanomicrobium pacificus]MXU64062.1 penicillin-insensitive murein endopeptidase [Oceanomicrobium pacificus]
MSRLSKFCLSAILSVAILSPTHAAQPAKQLFGAKATPSEQRSAALGSYSRGCLAGAEMLPESGPTWQAMRLSRNRNWGHPEMIRFIERLSSYTAAKTSWNGLYVGDIAQPRGGPMLSGHASHQLGLDADIWMKPAMDLTLSRNARENISSISVRSADQRNINGNWSRDHHLILRAAAKDPAVARIFVTAPVKLRMCKEAPAHDRAWLRKIRPWWGHHYHFHVRLNCPKGNQVCANQAPIPAGDGCEEAIWWVTEALEPQKPDPLAPKPKPKPKPKAITLADLPKQCQSVLQSR